MRIFGTGVVLALGLVLAPLRPVAAQPVVAVPPIEYSERTLPNGARVYAIRDPGASVASINVWYDVGQRDDPRGRGGFAHLFEHLMFRTTRNLAQGVSPFITSIGGSTNASTHFDYTNYYITAPANQLEALIWLEGERLRNLVVDEEAFRAEHDVVKEELRQRIFAQPYGRILYTLLPAFTFTTHPYARPIGGTIADLDQATLADVRAFHEAYYRPDNAIFVISGNFDPRRVDAWVDRYLGSVPRPAAPMPRDSGTEPERRASRTVDAYAPNVPLPAVVFSWHAPPADHPDSAGLSFIEALLTRGPSSRLRRALVDQQLASNVVAFNIVARDGHAFALNATLAQGREIAAAEAALAAEIARLRDSPVPAAELAAVKNGVLGDALLRRETARGRAFELGGGVALDGDPRFEDRRLEAIRRLTPGDVQRIARRWLSDARRVTLRYQDEARRPAGYTGDGAGADISAMGTEVPPATRPPVTIAAAGEREPAPAPSTALPRVVPAIADRRLANGMRLVSARSSEVPLVTLKLHFAGGDAADPAGKAGLADMLAALALRGAGGRDGAAIAEEAAALGGSIAASADPDAITLTMTVPAANAERAGRLLADIVLRPAFAEADLERVRRQQIDALTIASRQPVQAAVRVLPTVVFADSAYGQVPTAASLGAVSHADIVAAHRDSWRPAYATLVITGALAPDQAAALAQRLFGAWTGGTAPPPAAPRPIAAANPQVVVIDIPAAGQTAVVAAVPAAGRSDPGWPALRIANARLGGGQLGFLTQEIRVRRGLTYSAGSLLDSRRAATVVLAAAQTRNDAAVEVAGLMLEQLRRLSQEPVAAAEVAERSAYLMNGLASQTERTSGLADYLSSLVVTDAPLATARAELLGEAPVSPADVTAVAARHLRPDAATLVIAGDSRQWIGPMRERFPQLRVVNADGASVD